MKARLVIQQFELELSGEIASGRVISGEASGTNAEIQGALRSFGAAIAAPRARSSDPDTSHSAAARAIEFSGKHAAAIFTWLADHPTGGTKDEIADGTGVDSIAVARRMAGLCASGVYDSGERRKSRTGRASIVWKVHR